MTENGVLERRARELPPEYQQKVLDYIDSLLLDIQREKVVKPSFSWAGGLSDLHEDVFSLQKKALLWRDSDEVSD
nr:DUF2281 domain-containing protein [uncultured Methanospirillum sp.]